MEDFHRRIFINKNAYVERNYISMLNRIDKLSRGWYNIKTTHQIDANVAGFIVALLWKERVYVYIGKNNPFNEYTARKPDRNHL